MYVVRATYSTGGYVDRIIHSFILYSLKRLLIKYLLCVRLRPMYSGAYVRCFLVRYVHITLSLVEAEHAYPSSFLSIKSLCHLRCTTQSSCVFCSQFPVKQCHTKLTEHTQSYPVMGNAQTQHDRYPQTHTHTPSGVSPPVAT